MASDGVQSLERAFALLELMADTDGGDMALSQLAAGSGLPLSTIHRLVRTLVARGYVRQLPTRRYALGPRLIHLGESLSQALGTWAASAPVPAGGLGRRDGQPGNAGR